MTENTCQQPAREQLHEAESAAEQRMRHDFMQARAVSDRVERDPESYDPADAIDIGEYTGPWMDGQDRWAHEWLYLTDATTRWRDDPEAAAATMAARADALSPIEQRSEEQARYIAEHGFERDSSGLLISHYVTRVWECDDNYRTATGPVSALEGYRPGNTLARSVANTEHDGMER